MKYEARQINRFLAHSSIYFQQRKSKLGALFIYYGCSSSSTLFISEVDIDATCRVARVWIKVNSPFDAEWKGTPSISNVMGATVQSIQSSFSTATIVLDPSGTKDGGADAGPTPYDFLSAALGACTSMTMHFLAKRDKIPLEGADIEITNDRMYAKDCADCASSSGYIHRFTVAIKLLGDLTAEQRQRMLEVAKRCPVHKTLTSEIRIDERLVD